MTKKELIDILCDSLEIEEPTKVILGQINRYVTELGFTYKEIAQALVYFIEVNNGGYKKEYGIGIVPHVMEDAKKYFYNLRKEKEKQMESIKEAEKQPDIILKPQKIKKRRRLEPINIEDLNVD